jgi:hypothetical protein
MTCPVCDALRAEAQKQTNPRRAEKAWKRLVEHQTRDHIWHVAVAGKAKR